MIFQELDTDDLLSLIMQWGFVVIAILIIGAILIKWFLKRSFPKAMSAFYFAIPTYLINAVLVSSLGADTINEYTIAAIPTLGLYLAPPLVWDALFGMGVDQERIDLILVATFFIIFLPIWLGLKSSAGLNEEKAKKHIKLKRLLSAWVIVTILGLGMPNFYLYIFTFLVETQVLGLGLIFWISIAVGGIIIFVFWRKRRKKKSWSPEDNTNCQLINGEWVCPYDEK